MKIPIKSSNTPLSVSDNRVNIHVQLMDTNGEVVIVNQDLLELLRNGGFCLVPDIYTDHNEQRNIVSFSEKFIPELSTLDPNEEKALNLLVEAWNEYLKLPILNEWQQREFMHAIHQAQNIILSRPVLKSMGAPYGHKAFNDEP